MSANENDPQTPLQKGLDAVRRMDEPLAVRDIFAAGALAALGYWLDPHSPQNHAEVARKAFAIADAMMSARTKEFHE